MKQAWSMAVGLSLLSCSGAAAQSSADDTASALAACARVQSAVERLDCFDELARRVPGGTGPSSPPSVRSDPQPTTAPPPVTADTAPAATESGGSRRDARAADRADLEFTSSVAAVREIQPGRVEVTLENGQVWRQTHSDRYNLLVGHEVRVYPTGFGQYFRLTSSALRGFIQVERVR